MNPEGPCVRAQQQLSSTGRVPVGHQPPSHASTMYKVLVGVGEKACVFRQQELENTPRARWRWRGGTCCCCSMRVSKTSSLTQETLKLTIL